MDIERETLLQIVISAVAVVFFVAAAAFVSQTYMVDTSIGPTGGVALVGVIGLFIVVMTVAGLWLERQQF